MRGGFMNTTKKLNSIDYIECVLLSIILCMNAIRTIFGIAESNSIILFIYFLYILCIINKFSIGIYRNTFTISAGILVVYAFFTVFIYGINYDINSFSVWLKFFIGMLIALKTLSLSKEQLHIILNMIIFICVVYAAFIITNYNTVVSFTNHESNYLNTTLPLGLCLSMLLPKLFEKNKLAQKTFFFLICILVFYAMIQFAARGNLLFPIIAALLAVLLKSTGKKDLFIKLIVFTIIVYIGYVFMNSYASDYLLGRLDRLFYSTMEESRIGLWGRDLKLLFTNNNWFFGIGIHGYKNYTGTYPHNFLLEIFCELGIIGISTSLFILIKLLTDIIKSAIIKRREKLGSTDFYLIFSGLVFFILTFSKSYSIYDGYQLFVLIAMQININNKTQEPLTERICK